MLRHVTQITFDDTSLYTLVVDGEEDLERSAWDGIIDAIGGTERYFGAKYNAGARTLSVKVFNETDWVCDCRYGAGTYSLRELPAALVSEAIREHSSTSWLAA